MPNKKLLISADAGLVPSENFNTVIYSNPGLSTPISVGFGPDMVLFKERNGTNSWQLYDTVRGDDYALYTNDSQAQYNYSTHSNGDLSPTITSTGFTTPPVTNNGINSSSNYVSYSWKAGGAAVSNTDGTITSQVSANPSAGFSIVEHTGTGVAATVGHGLSSAPELIIYKQTSSTAVGKNWVVYASPLGNTKTIGLNLTGTAVTDSDGWNDTTPTATVFSLGIGDDNYGSQTNVNGSENIVYCFHSVAGYSKIGSYSGNGSATGPIITTGFEPAWVMIKRTDSGLDTGSAHWAILDNKRDTTNPNDNRLLANLSNAEVLTDTNWAADFNSTSFQIKSAFGQINASGGTFIYMAFAS